MVINRFRVKAVAKVAIIANGREEQKDWAIREEIIKISAIRLGVGGAPMFPRHSPIQRALNIGINLKEEEISVKFRLPARI